MFSNFFYLLRARGMDISLKEWFTLMEALKMGLHGASMGGFYNLCRAILCKSEADYDRFGLAFQEFFYDKKVHKDGRVREEISQELLDWLNDPDKVAQLFGMREIPEELKHLTPEEIEQMFRERLLEQHERHDGGKYWIGTGGVSPFGNMGFNPNGIRVGGQSKYGAALRVAGSRTYRDFREDNVLSIRQFQMAFRKLQRYSNQGGAEEEFDVERTIDATCKEAGILQIRYKKPRKNTIKVLLLIDSGGSMAPYSSLCSQLFQAASRSNRFKDLQVYYFHNCPSQVLYTSPELSYKHMVHTRDILKNCDKDYRVILVGDATMGLDDLVYSPYRSSYYNMGYSGLDWLNHISSHYRHSVWMTPYLRPKREPGRRSYFSYWGESYYMIGDIFPMYHLTVAGLEQALKRLMVRE